MTKSKNFFAMAAIAMALLVLASATPVLADPTGTTFEWLSSNFQGDGADPAVPFGTPTSIAGSGVTVGSSVSTSVPTDFFGTPLTFGGLDYVEFVITTDDSGFLAGSLTEPSTWIISGLNWGPDEPPGIAAGLIFISFAADGAFVPLDGTGFGLPVVPNPGTFAGVTGAPAIPLDIAGDPVDLIPWDTFELAETTMGGILIGLGLDVSTALSVDSMHVGFEVTHIPEATSLLLVGMGCLALTAGRRRRR